MSKKLWNGYFCGLFVLLTTALLFSGCARKTPYEYFYEGNFLEAKKAYKPLIPKDKNHKNHTYHCLHYASCAMEGGDYYCSDQYIANCQNRMEAIEGKSEQVAVIFSESSKEYKGDPYEKAMASTYLGFAYLRQNDYERALALFRKALVDDQDTRTKKIDMTKDFVTGHYFTGLSFCLLGEPENAAVEFNLAEKYSAPCDFYTVKKAKSSNCFLLIACGAGPVKNMYGPGNSMVKVVKAHDPVSKIIFLCDGKEMGQAVLMDDMLVEAKAQSWGKMDTARLVKGIGKEIVSRIPVFGILHNVLRSEADIRVWSFLPGNIYLWSGTIDSGLHTFALQCYDKKDRHLDCYDQVWFDVPTYSTKPTFMNFRLIPYRQDIKNKVVVPCSSLINKK
ncbi:MAG: tetratricopeptide repeat protein [Sedimentisphaerales bacterium]|nr:tetratricopeptide repeat protein [Sedimentisphaerales bacterium]